MKFLLSSALLLLLVLPVSYFLPVSLLSGLATAPVAVNATKRKTSVAKSDKMTTLNASTVDCLKEIQMKLKRPLRPANIPSLLSMLRLDNRFHLIFDTYPVQSEYKSWTSEAQWFCENELIPKSKIKAAQTIRSSFVLDCPLDKAKTVTVINEKGVNATYSTDFLQRCSDPLEGLPPSITERGNLMVCTMIRQSNNLFRQWYEYHRRIGYEHFLIYVNEPFIKERLPHGSDITYVPWDIDGSLLGTQPAHIQDCILRARAANVTWLVIHDVDEYMRTVPTPDDNNQNQIVMNRKEGVTDETCPPYPGGDGWTLEHVLRSHETDKKLGGLQIPSWFFGTPPGIRMNSTYSATLNSSTIPSSSKPLLIDHVHRAPSPQKKGREKVFHRPYNVQYASPHLIDTGGPMKKEPRIRMHHYKHPDKGIFVHSGTKPVTEPIYDDCLVRNFGPILRDRLST